MTTGAMYACAKKKNTYHNFIYEIVSEKRDLTHVFSTFRIVLYSTSLKCPLNIASYVLTIGVSVMEFYGAKIFISHTFPALHFYCAYCVVC